jgi:hypothetical protein
MPSGVLVPEPYRVCFGSRVSPTRGTSSEGFTASLGGREGPQPRHGRPPSARKAPSLQAGQEDGRRRRPCLAVATPSGFARESSARHGSPRVPCEPFEGRRGNPPPTHGVRVPASGAVGASEAASSLAFSWNVFCVLHEGRGPDNRVGYRFVRIWAGLGKQQALAWRAIARLTSSAVRRPALFNADFPLL